MAEVMGVGRLKLTVSHHATILRHISVIAKPVRDARLEERFYISGLAQRRCGCGIDGIRNRDLTPPPDPLAKKKKKRKKSILFNEKHDRLVFRILRPGGLLHRLLMVQPIK